MRNAYRSNLLVHSVQYSLQVRYHLLKQEMRMFYASKYFHQQAWREQCGLQELQ